ncbi:MAG: type II toxin-antitoxin system PemK/MazF family toxin [Atopobiaceae bacterium]|nr:type II toxin-antitoxin system PemK/MazF family toxin [Atopobiaceae bacterium]
MAYRCGDVVWADLDPSAGHEQTKRRPLIVVSNDKFNAHCNLTMTVPITSSTKPYPLHVDVGIVPSEAGERPIHGFAEAEQFKSLDLDARNAMLVGRIGPKGMDKLVSLVLGCLITPEMTIYSY